MGLDTSHDGFHGSYSAFNRFRQEVAYAAGCHHPPHWVRNADGSLARGADGLLIYDRERDQQLVYFADDVSRETTPGLFEFLTHSDCDGQIDPAMCALVADELEALLPAIAKAGEGGGHIARDGGFAAVTRRFIAGCRAAHAAGEPLDFH